METNSAALKKEYLALLERFPLAPIRSKTRDNAAVQVMKELSKPMRLKDLTPAEADYLDVLTQLISKYEQVNWEPLAEAMRPREVLQYLLQQSGTTQSALARAVGARQSHISEFLLGKRDLSKDSMVKIAAYFNITPALLMK